MLIPSSTTAHEAQHDAISADIQPADQQSSSFGSRKARATPPFLPSRSNKARAENRNRHYLRRLSYLVKVDTGTGAANRVNVRAKAPPFPSAHSLRTALFCACCSTQELRGMGHSAPPACTTSQKLNIITAEEPACCRVNRYHQSDNDAPACLPQIEHIVSRFLSRNCHLSLIKFQQRRTQVRYIRWCKERDNFWKNILLGQ